MKRLSGWALPIILGMAGVTLILIGTLDVDGDPPSSLPPILTPSPTPVARATPTPTAAESGSAAVSQSPTPSPTPSPVASNVVAAQLEIPSIGLNVLVKQSTSDAIDEFPPTDAAYILRGSDQPGRNTNSYIFAHALNSLFKPLWNAQIGAEVLMRMSDDSVLRYIVTEVRPNVACPAPPDPALDPADPPLALQIHDSCDDALFWTAPTGYERLTLQTSQGYNRNWGELVVVAEPVR